NLGLDPKSGKYIENYNYAVGNQGLTEPGSTFKLASLMALFEDSNVELEDTVHTGNGKFKFYDKVMTDSKPEGYGTLTVKESFEKSSNVAVSRLVYEHFGKSPGVFRNYIRKFGLDKPIGFQMTGEANPYVKNPEDSSWSGITLPWMSIGYEVQLSPLQILTFYNAVANNGKMISPLIVKAIYKADMKIEEYETRVINEKICSDKTLEKVRMMLEGVVENGTAKNIKNEHYKIGGKTGTAQKIKDGAYTKTYYTSFVGYFPAKRPKYSCIVVIDNPKGFLQYGSDVSAPVFKEVADKIYSLDVEMQRPLVKDPLAKQGVFPEIKAGHAEELKKLCNQLGISNHTQGNEEWVGSTPSNNAVLFRDRPVRQGLVPDVTGMTLRDALYILENNGLRVQFAGRGRIVEQSLSPGTRIAKGGTIYLRLS
ncbi:MAG: PASTA domain-containing protein, partial [Cytophagales bacterium]|nr:PASTA domain-containing protein [Cytophagales bacterium]